MKKVLVVDDSPSVRQQVSLTLAQGGYTVVEATDGQDALSKTAGVSLIISDLNMPRLNGLEMLEKLKAEGKIASLPVIMLTSEAMPALMERAKKAGAVGWIIKPFKANLLLAAVKQIIGT